MAIKYYGSCSGNAGSKYNIWLEVAENSQSIENNSSNITLKLKLKRNDGYSGSAYNLNENENFAKITINGNIVVSKNLEIDTRNNVMVTLLTWKGDVTHNTDGTLIINVAGVFTMSGTSLDGGSVSGSFQCVSIPRSSSFSLSKTSVVPDEEITIYINSNSSVFSHKLILELGDYVSKITIPANINEYLFSIPEEWARALPKSKTGNIAVTLKTYSNGKSVGSVKKQIVLEIPETENFLPEYLVNVKDNKNGLVPSNWSAVLQNRSTLTVKIHSMVTKFGATISSSYIIVGDIKKYGLEADFDLPDSGMIKITTHLEDSRGFVKEETYIYEVCAYISPTINCNSLIRCDSSGAVSENGTSALLDYTPYYSSVYGLNYVRCYAKYKKNGDTTYSEPILLTQNPFIIDGNFSLNSSYDFIIYVKDAVSSEQFEITRSLASGYIAFNIRKGGKGAAFGCYSENENELTVGYNLNLKGEITSRNLSGSINSGAGFSLQSVDVKGFDCLSTVVLKVEIKAENNINSGEWNELFSLTSSPPLINTSLNVVTGNYEIDKNIKCFIDTTGVAKLISAINIAKDTRIYINGFY